VCKEDRYYAQHKNVPNIWHAKTHALILATYNFEYIFSDARTQEIHDSKVIKLRKQPGFTNK